MRTLLAGLSVAVLATAPGFSQSVISAHSGVIHLAEGTVFVDGKAFQNKTNEFENLKDKSELSTEEGRVELLLTPGVFLRVGENSAVRMVSSRLSDTRVEVLKGEALVECDTLLKDNQVTMLYKDASVAIEKHGLYRFDTYPAGRLRVYEGEAVVNNGSGQLTVKKGHEALLTGALMAVKFDLKDGDELMRWASRRSESISLANVSSAHSLGASGYAGSGWTYNPWFGMFTFIPGSGMLYSPFGFPFWSPYAAYYYAPYYYPYGYYGGGVYTPVSTATAYHAAPRWNGSASGGGRLGEMSRVGGIGGTHGGGRGYSGPAGNTGGFSGASAGGGSVGGGGVSGAATGGGGRGGMSGGFGGAGGHGGGHR